MGHSRVLVYQGPLSLYFELFGHVLLFVFAHFGIQRYLYADSFVDVQIQNLLRRWRADKDAEVVQALVLADAQQVFVLHTHKEFVVSY